MIISDQFAGEASRSANKDEGTDQETFSSMLKIGRKMNLRDEANSEQKKRPKISQTKQVKSFSFFYPSDRASNANNGGKKNRGCIASEIIQTRHKKHKGIEQETSLCKQNIETSNGFVCIHSISVIFSRSLAHT